MGQGRIMFQWISPAQVAVFTQFGLINIGVECGLRMMLA